ncbi:MAG: hypothetical protein KDI46_01110 [Alphaproteobacteria bacterium]|nr:hypothetical protein [Alphaproteobacteria bacterium]
MIETIISKTIEYLGVPSVVGHEQCFMDFLERDFQALGLEIHRQAQYLVVSGRNPSSAIVCAHIDRHGLISLGDDEYVYAAQYIKEIKYGENNRLAQQQLESIARRFEGEDIYAYDRVSGVRLGQGVIEICNPCMLNGDALFFVKDMASMRAGVPLAYARTARYEDGALKGQLDNAISLGVIYTLFQQGFQGTAILTTEEEIGKSWLHILDYLEAEALETRNLVVIDTSPYTDQAIINNGPVVFRSRDMSGVFNAELVGAMKERAESLGLDFQVKDEVLLAAGKTVEQLGSTELGRLVKGTQGRWNGATVQIPTLMYHTSNETTTAQAIGNFWLFLASILIENPLSVLCVRQEASVDGA